LKSGWFITLEGGEGAGKSTQHQRIIEWLSAQGMPVVEAREPGGTPVSEQIRQVLLDTRNAGLSAYSELLLLFAARAQLLQDVIRPAIAEGKVVVCDRFTDASYAYQGGGRDLGEAAVSSIENLVHPDLQPDVTLLFDISVERGMSRVAGRGEADRFEVESLRFFEKVRNTYLKRASADPERFIVIDADQSEEQVWNDVRNSLQERFIR
jgi:dTMP kinase